MEKLKGLIGCLIVDEAAQSTEPDILIPFQSGVRKILLIGDPYQLPSTTISQDSSITLFNRSLFERFLNN
jgi:senataxin